MSAATLANAVRRARTTSVVYSTHTGRESHAATLARIYAASVAPLAAAPCAHRDERCRVGRNVTDYWQCQLCQRIDPPVEAVCRTATPEPHLAGEFPLSCHACHVTENY